MLTPIQCHAIPVIPSFVFFDMHRLSVRLVQSSPCARVDFAHRQPLSRFHQRPRFVPSAQSPFEHQIEEEESEVPSRHLSQPPSLLSSQDSIRRMDSSLTVQMVQWYPGHIAKAERQLKEQLKMVDVVLEVRDARIIASTSHPQVPSWIGPKPSLLVINRADSIKPEERREWSSYFHSIGKTVYWTDGKLGSGVAKLKDELLRASIELDAKRAKRGLEPRPVRACVIGFPNIGKSALINRLLSRRVVDSAARPGVTRVLKWVRLGGKLDMLDAPGVIPASFDDQVAAQRLAMCNDIGEASYVDSLIATALVVRCKSLSYAGEGKPGRVHGVHGLTERYKPLDPLEGTAEDYVRLVADRIFLGDVEKAGARILKDFRTGYLGSFALESPKDIRVQAGHKSKSISAPRVQSRDSDWHVSRSAAADP